MSDLVPFNDPILKTNLEIFNFFDPPIDPIELSNELVHKMVDLNGIGLSANQLGYPHRVFTVFSQPFLVCFNPRIIDKKSEEIELDEGCLSFPGLILKIKRSEAIKVRYTQPNGEVVTKIFNGMTARIMQHEIDHMNGILFTKYASKFQLERAITKSNKDYGTKYKIGELWQIT